MSEISVIDIDEVARTIEPREWRRADINGHVLWEREGDNRVVRWRDGFAWLGNRPGDSARSVESLRRMLSIGHTYFEGEEACRSLCFADVEDGACVKCDWRRVKANQEVPEIC